MDRLIGHSNELSITINGTETYALIDSGSSITTISEDLYKSLLPIPELRPLTDLKVEVAGGYTLPYSGYIECAIGVPFLEKEIYIPALIVPTTDYSLKVPVVVGTNVIRECWNTPDHIKEVPKE